MSESKKMQQIKQVVAKAVHHREQIEAHAQSLQVEYDRLLTLMQYPAGSYAADVMEDVVFHGRDFFEAVEAIVRHKQQQQSTG